jgi:hypothetical protein
MSHTFNTQGNFLNFPHMNFVDFELHEERGEEERE